MWDVWLCVPKTLYSKQCIADKMVNELHLYVDISPGNRKEAKTTAIKQSLKKKVYLNPIN